MGGDYHTSVESSLESVIFRKLKFWSASIIHAVSEDFRTIQGGGIAHKKLYTRLSWLILPFWSLIRILYGKEQHPHSAKLFGMAQEGVN